MTINKLTSVVQPLAEVAKINEIIDALDSSTEITAVAPLVLEEGMLSVNADTTVGTNPNYLVTSGAVETAINNAIVGGVRYIGTWTATNQTDYSSITLPVKKGYLYLVEGSATIGEIEWKAGDYLLINADVASDGTITNVKKIDNTESDDIVKLNVIQILTNKTIDADDNTITNLEVDNFKSGVIQNVVRGSNSATNNNLASEKAIADALATKQETLTAGNGITIANNIISFSGNISFTSECPALTPVDGVCTWEVIHNLGTTNIVCALFQGNKEIAKDVRINSTNSVIIRFNASTSVEIGSHKIIVMSTGATPVQYKTSNMIKYGNIIENNGIITGFSGENVSYTKMPSPFMPSTYNWEIGMKFKIFSIPTDTGENYYFRLVASEVDAGIPLNITSWKYDNTRCYVSIHMRSNTWTSKSPYWDLVDGITSNGQIIEPYYYGINENVWFKLIYENGTYSIHCSPDGKNYIKTWQYTTDKIIMQHAEPLRFGNGGAPYFHPLDGEIDLNECYTSINGSRTWSGVTPVGENIDSRATKNLLEALYPVGSLYFGTMQVCPIQVLGVGTWQLKAQDKVIQGAGTRGNVGTTVDESLPNIKGDLYVGTHSGQWGLIANECGATQSGAFYTTADGTYTQMVNTGQSKPSSRTKFSANKSSNIYQDNAPVQQDAYLVNIWERVA